MLVAIIDAVLTRTPLFYGELSIERPRGDLHLAQYVQTMRVARAIFHPTHVAHRVVLLGDSRIMLAARAPTLEREIRRVAPHLDIEVQNLSIFGMRIGDLEALSRYLDRLKPAVVVVALGGWELLRGPDGHLGSYPSQIFDLGWRDGPIPPTGFEDRLDRWLRTAWPLYRYRTLVDMVLADRLFPDPNPPRPVPRHRLSTRGFFAYRDSLTGAHTSRREFWAYEAWRRDATFEGFLQYLRATGALPIRNFDQAWQAQLTPESPVLQVLDRLLDRLGRSPWATRILLMPENPLLNQDTSGQYHLPGLSDRTSILVSAAARRHGVQIVDGRRWVGSDAFVDFLHLFPDRSDFQRPLAQEVVNALHVETAERH